METNNEPIQIKLELGLHNAAAIRHVLFKELSCSLNKT